MRGAWVSRARNQGRRPISGSSGKFGEVVGSIPHSHPKSLCASGASCCKNRFFERLHHWVLENIGVHIRPYWHPGFLVFFCVFNNSRPLASLLGRQNTWFFELWCRRDAFFENRNRYGSIPVAMSKKKWPPFVTFWHRNRYGSMPRAIDFPNLHTLHDFCDLEIQFLHTLRGFRSADLTFLHTLQHFCKLEIPFFK